jgi:hypothetical protein
MDHNGVGEQKIVQDRSEEAFREATRAPKPGAYWKYVRTFGCTARPRNDPQ